MSFSSLAGRNRYYSQPWMGSQECFLYCFGAVFYLALVGFHYMHLLISILLHTWGKAPADLWSFCEAVPSLVLWPGAPAAPAFPACLLRLLSLLVPFSALQLSDSDPVPWGPSLFPISQRSLSLLLMSSVLGTIVSYILSSFWLFQEGSKSSTCYSSLARSRLSD